MVMVGCGLKHNIINCLSSAMIVDLTHTCTHNMPVHQFDDPIAIEKVRNLDRDKYNDWRLCCGMHVGTHIDGPGHLTRSDRLMSQMPVERFFAKGVIVDARNKDVIDVSLLDGISIDKDSIVLIYTGWDARFGTAEYFNKHPIIAQGFAQELVKRHVNMVGIDFFSPDTYPFAVHQIFFEHDILIIENLTNLGQLLDAKQFSVVALPLKVATDSALARVVAIVE